MAPDKKDEHFHDGAAESEASHAPQLGDETLDDEPETSWEQLLGALRQMGVADGELEQEPELPVEFQFTPAELEAGRRMAQRAAFRTLLGRAQLPYDGQWLGGWLRDVRVKQGLSAAEVGDLFELSAAEWLELERNQEKVASLSEKTVAAILDVFQLPLPRALQMLRARTKEGAGSAGAGAPHEELQLRIHSLCRSTALVLLLEGRRKQSLFPTYGYLMSALPESPAPEDVAHRLALNQRRLQRKLLVGVTSTREVSSIYRALERTQQRLRALSKRAPDPGSSDWASAVSEQSSGVVSEHLPSSPFRVEGGEAQLGAWRPKTRA